MNARHAMLLRLLLALAYPLLAHLASARHAPVLAAVALADIAVIVLLYPLLQWRPRAWALLVAIGIGLVALAQSRLALPVLLLVPVALVGFVAWTFARTLRRDRVPLITRIVAALDGIAPSALAPELRSYTRRLTAAWAGVLVVLALVNLLLALCAVPNGVLAGLGITPPWTVTEAQWSWFANLMDYGIVGGFFFGEYLLRKRLFPGRYHSFLDFMQRMARLGPEVWRDLMR